MPLLFAIVVAVVVIAGVVWTLRSGRRERDSRPPYVVALVALADGDEETAFAELKNAVRRDSGNVDAYLRLGDVFRRRGDAERAYQIHRELASRSGLPSAVRGRVHVSLCHDLVALGRLPRADEAIREAIRLSPDPLDALVVRLDVLRRTGDVEGAFRVRKEIQKRRGRQKDGASELAAFRADQAEALLERNDLQGAEHVLRDARKLDAHHARAAYLWGLVKERQGDHGAAIEAWNGILRDRPHEVVRLFRSLERVRFLDGTYSEMEPTYLRFLETVPGHEDASFGLARFLRRKGHLDEALRVCRQGLDAHPRSESLRVFQLSLLLESGRTGEAENVLNDWIGEILGEDSPDSRPAPPARPSDAADDPLIESAS